MMSIREPSWDLYETFLAVMRHGSLAAAARAMRTAQPTIRRRVETLEQVLAVVLFTRSPTGLLPTEAARRTLPFAEAMESIARACTRATSAIDDHVSGTVRISCSEVMAVEVVTPLLAPLLRQHPALQIEIVAANVVDDLLRRDADLAVRMVRPTQTGLVARRVGSVTLGLYASDSYLALTPAPETITDLASHILIGGDRTDLLQSLLAELDRDVPLRYGVRSDSDLTQLAAVRSGMGIGVSHVAIARRAPDLVAVLPDLTYDLEAWLVCHEDLRDTARIRLLMDHLAVSLFDYCSIKRADRP